MSEWYEREARRASLDDAAGRDLETGDDYDEPVLSGAELVAEHTGRPVFPVDAVCPTLGCGKRADRVQRSETVLEQYRVVGATADAVVIEDEALPGGEVTDSEAVALICPSGHRWAFPYGTVDYEWLDSTDPDQGRALDDWRAFYGDPLVSDEERARREAVEAATGEPWCNHDAAAIGADGVCECGAMLVEEPEPDAEHEAFCEHYDGEAGR